MKRKYNTYIIDNDYTVSTICLKDGTDINFTHYQECCENVYADLTALDNTGFEKDDNFTFDNVIKTIRFVKDYGITICGYGIPCYNCQNGWYSDIIEIEIVNEETYQRKVYDISLGNDLGIEASD